MSGSLWAAMLAAASVGTAWYFVAVRPKPRQQPLDSTLDVALLEGMPGVAGMPESASIPGVFDAPAVAPKLSTQARAAALISDPRVRPYLGIAVAAIIWIVGGRGGLAIAFLALWYAGRALLRARTRNRLSMEQERCALHAITTASRALRAGIPIAGMMQILANEGEGDAGKAFQEIVQRENLGEELPTSVRGVLLNSPLPALRAFGLSLLVQFEAGGNVADTTDRLARSLIDRGRIRRRAKTIVSYGRTTAFALAFGPVIITPLMAMNVAGYSEFILDRPIGNMLLAVSAILLATGLVWVHRISRIEVTPTKDWA